MTPRAPGRDQVSPHGRYRKIVRAATSRCATLPGVTANDIEIDDEFFDRWVRRLREEVPDAVAILTGGSRLRGDAGPYSDVDFDVVVAEGPREEWPSWTEGPVRISAWVRDIDAINASFEEAQDWAFHLAASDSVRPCWFADDTWRERALDDRPANFPDGPVEIDHFESYLGKIANSRYRDDDLGLRLSAQDLAHAVISVLAPLNPRPPVGGRRAALQAVLDFRVVPGGYRDDITACLGLSHSVDMYATASRLARGVADLLHEHAEGFAGLVRTDELDRLRDGSLRDFAYEALPADDS